MRGRVPWGLVAALFVIVPLVEIYLIVQAGQAIGIGWTILILVADSLLGAVLLKREGVAAWRSLTSALASYRVPARELADGALVLVGGTLLLTPGFFTDALGFFFLLPFTRPIARRALTAVITRKFLGGPAGPATSGPTRSASWGEAGRGEGARTRQSPGAETVRGEVVD
ncbi:MAG TPA: FxsA family protein [Nocardioidaceae bacterium]|nr:FxsA family protein [Nocardioidaceae bacterium]